MGSSREEADGVRDTPVLNNQTLCKALQQHTAQFRCSCKETLPTDAKSPSKCATVLQYADTTA